ncbi:hypothetical protein HYG86_09215 [Alkalicella caledoniensis]|uniref:DUF1540 domain-containing protein n=1 Tax=Alkalicella caledoniensis TaxID=2731377 RepID=A0A7G9W8C8_ALKCA|nr:hypothetical protein [Alkalicella caledoniensis]QNO14940.1 hypothetical protein HYG86_09215 [Alkalicella caledoniensis]
MKAKQCICFELGQNDTGYCHQGDIVITEETKSICDKCQCFESIFVP